MRRHSDPRSYGNYSRGASVSMMFRAFLHLGNKHTALSAAREMCTEFLNLCRFAFSTVVCDMARLHTRGIREIIAIPDVWITVLCIKHVIRTYGNFSVCERRIVTWFFFPLFV
jgi:hypothetical protein